MQCPRCQQENPTSHKFCRDCGTPLARLEAGAQPALSYAEVQHSLTEALEQQTATSEILRVISSSPSDIQPVFDAIAANAARLCESFDSTIYRPDGDRLLLVAHHGPIPVALRVGESSLPPGRGTAAGRAVLDGRTIHVADMQTEVDEFPESSENARHFGFRTILSVPLMLDSVAIGVISLLRTESRLFTERHVHLLQTFADQAVIAIENARLFNETTEALEQQTATSEILRVISRSPTDLQPVLDAVAENAARVCNARDAVLFRLEGDTLRIAAQYGTIPSSGVEQHLSVNRGWVTGRAVVDRQTIHVKDLAAASEAEFPQGRERAQRFGHRTTLATPLLRQGVALGAILIRRTEVQPFTDNQVKLLQTFADQAVIAIENVRLFTELADRNRDLTEALEQQTATSEILRVISSSPTDVQPVFDAIAHSAARLCEAEVAGVFRYDGQLLHFVAHHGLTPEGAEAMGRAFPMAPSRGSAASRAVLSAGVEKVPDVHVDPDYVLGAAAQAGKFRSTVGVPMVRNGVPIGSITISRTRPGLLPDAQVELLKTFADQAVIAIENVRLFKELEARNRDLTATGEILRVISSSPTDVQPVFDTIAASAARLCESFDALIFRVDGDRLRLVAHHGSIPLGTVGEFTVSLDRGTLPGRSALDGRTIHVADLQAEAAEFPEGSEVAQRMGFRTALTIPLMREGIPIGVIALRRTEIRLFSERQIDLLDAFADQAVIAIENVRLFTELEARNRELTNTLARQVATSEVLRAISNAHTDIQPVFEIIARSARRLCGAAYAQVQLSDGHSIHLAALDSANPEGDPSIRAAYPLHVGDGSAGGRAIQTRAVTEIPDLLDEGTYAFKAVWESSGLRSLLAIPMLRDGTPIGTIGVGRVEPGRFPQSQIDLLQTFADQAVIALENARLFKELQSRTEQLTRSVDQLTALGEVGRAVSSTLDLETVLTTIVSRAVQLSGLDGGVVFEYSEGTEEFLHRAATETGGTLAEARRTTRVRRGEGVVGQTALTLEPAQVPDITMPGAYDSRLRGNLIESGVRGILAVPMLREGQLIGCLVVSRNRPGDFPAEAIELLRTFATQSALAIQNARLFREIEDKSRQLEAASRHKSEFLANMSHELRTPLNAIIGFSEVLAEKMFGDVNDKQVEYLQDILESGRHLLSLINDILDLSKIEAGRMELELAEFDLPQAIENALTLVRERALRRGIALHHVIHDRVADIRADERKVKQVLLNLLSNAIKFTPEGGRIDVRAAPADGLVEVSVTDSGVGIAPEDQEAVFEEFRQVGTADKKAEGTGLGLTLCRKFVELHGGTIWVTSAVGAGSTFTFRLPVRPWPAR